MDYENEVLKVKTSNVVLVSKYPSDFIGSNSLAEEIVHMANVHSTIFQSEKNSMKLLNSIYEKNLQTIFVLFLKGHLVDQTAP